MKEKLEMVGGSVIGRYHWQKSRNNQDSYGGVITDDYLIGVVCDGCGSGEHSEVGAQWGVPGVISAISRVLNQDNSFLTQEEESPPEAFWTTFQEELLNQLGQWVRGLDSQGKINPHIVHNYALFTIVGVLITAKSAVIFSWGDGIVILNNTLTELGPFPNNCPPYLGYELLKDGNSFCLNTLPFSEFNTLLLGTDGVMELIKSSQKNLPGKTELVGEINQFWLDDRYFKNPDQIRRRLSLINRETSQINWSSQQVTKTGGLLQDDTTFIVIRKKS